MTVMPTADSVPRPRIGIALGAGVARGFAHIGVLRVLEKHGIPVDIIAGTSIGSVVAGLYLAGKLDALEEWALSLTTWKVISYFDLRVSAGGLIGGNKLVALIREHIGETTFAELSKPCCFLATDLTTGHEVWLRDGDLTHAMRASFALPGVFPPVPMNGQWLVDGALTNPVPVSVCRALGAQVVLAINLGADLLGKTRQANNIPRVAGFDLLDEMAKGAQPAASSRLDWLTRRLFSREPSAPSLFGSMVASLAIVQDRIARSRLAGDPPDLHVIPKVGHIGMLEFQRAQELIDLGAEAMELAMPDLLEAVAVTAAAQANVLTPMVS
jgi:NTE family protein